MTPGVAEEIPGWVRSTRDARHWLACAFRADGYTVVEDPGPDDLPETLWDYHMDLLAVRGEEHVGDPHRAERLRPYAIGEDIAKQSRAALTQTTTNILQALTTDALPGITPAKVAALQSALSSWIATDRAQGGAGETVLQTRKEINDLLGTIATRRQTIQFAADAAYPSHNRSNAETRALFGLSRTRPYSPKLG